MTTTTTTMTTTVTTTIPTNRTRFTLFSTVLPTLSKVSTEETAFTEQTKVSEFHSTESSEGLRVEDEENSEMHENKTWANCSCVYDQEESSVVAYNEEGVLTSGSLVDEGDKVHFFCKNLGFDHLVGERETVCENCKWRIPNFPLCEKPSKGDVIVTIAPESAFLSIPRGIFLIEDGKDVTISCYLFEENEWAEFENLPPAEYSSVDYRTFKYWSEETKRSHSILFSHLNITNIDSSYSGKYECVSSKERGNSNYIEIEVTKGLCPIISEDRGDLSVIYSGGRSTHSYAKFRCLKKGNVLNGFHQVTCLPNGKWSQLPPTCLYVECLEIVPDGNMRISYSDDSRVVNSKAQFECLESYVLQGEAVITCMKDGLWSSDIPTCEYVFCDVESLRKILPIDVRLKEKPNGEQMPYGTELLLECSDVEETLFGSLNATCTEAGIWRVDAKCLQGCDPIPLKVGTVLLEPIKEKYRFGDLVTLSCPPGYVLDSLTVQLMCLKGGWSETPNPVCRSI